MTSDREPLDGHRDFDFLAGSWRVPNRKLRDPTPGAPAEWIEFESDVERWQQSFSFDGGTTFALNWVMTFSRGGHVYVP